MSHLLLREGTKYSAIQNQKTNDIDTSPIHSSINATEDE